MFARMARLVPLMAALFAVPALAADPVELGAGQAVLLRLDRAAAQIVVGDPAVADVSVESPHLLAVFGKRPGITTLAVLDKGRRVVLEAPVVVQAGGAGAVTVTYGAGKEIKPGGARVVYGCATSCSRAEPAARE